MDIETLFTHLDDTALRRFDQDFPRSAGHPHDVAQSPDQLLLPSDFERLVRMADPLVREYDDICSPEWEQSPIGWIRQVSSAHKRGKIGEQLVRAWALSEGLQVGGRGHRGHDCLVEGLKLEVKTSLRWNNDRFVFLGLRDFDYDAVALLGLEPNDFSLWIVPRHLLWQRAKDQLRGVSGEGSKWLSFPAGEPPAWLRPWGGSFAEAAAALQVVPSYQLERDSELDQHDAWLELSSDIDWPWQPGDQGVAHDGLRDTAQAASQFDTAPFAPLIGTATASADGANPLHTSPPKGATHVIHQPRDPHWESHE